MIRQVLDAVAQSLVVPMVESAEQAAELIRATRYPPEGIRGVDSSLARASRFAGIPDYVTTANGEVCLLLQVESRAGLAALDEILAVDGVDGAFIGSADLAANMGYPGKTGAPQVKEAVLDAIRRIAAAGKAPGVLATDPLFIQECRGDLCRRWDRCHGVRLRHARASGQIQINIRPSRRNCREPVSARPCRSRWSVCCRRSKQYCRCRI